MAKHRLGILAFPFLSIIVQIGGGGGVAAWAPNAAPSTTTSVRVSSTSKISPPASPLPTQPPISPEDLATYEAPNICGWIDHKFSNSYTCGGNNTCLWNTDLYVVGCGRTDSIVYFTSCMPNRLLQYCDSACFANPSIVKCGSQIPHCATPRVGPYGAYSIHACQSLPAFGNSTVHLTYSGQSSIQHLPRFLGNDSVITYGTGKPSPPVKTTSDTAWAEETETNTKPYVYVVTTVPEGWKGEGGKGGNATGQWWVGQYERAQRRKEVIVGCVIGSFMFLVIGIFGGVLLLAWRRRRRKALEEGEKGANVGLRSLSTGASGSESPTASGGSGVENGPRSGGTPTTNRRESATTPPQRNQRPRSEGAPAYMTTAAEANMRRHNSVHTL